MMGVTLPFVMSSGAAAGDGNVIFSESLLRVMETGGIS